MTFHIDVSILIANSDETNYHSTNNLFHKSLRLIKKSTFQFFERILRSGQDSWYP